MESTASEVWLVSPRPHISEMLRACLPAEVKCRVETSLAPASLSVPDSCIVCVDVTATFPAAVSSASASFSENYAPQVLAGQKTVSHEGAVNGTISDGLAWIGAARRAKASAPLVLVATEEDEISSQLASLALAVGATDFLILNDLSSESVALLLEHINLQRRNDVVALRCDAINSVIGNSAQEFLRNDWRLHINAMLAALGLATGVTHVYLRQLETHIQSSLDEHCHEIVQEVLDGELMSFLLHDWALPNFTPLHEHAWMRHLSLKCCEFAPYVQSLLAGETNLIQTRSFEPLQRQRLEAAQLRSWLVVPVMVEGAWGYLGFNQANQDRSWHDLEIKALQKAAQLLAAAIAQQRTEQQRQENAHALRAAMRFNEEVISTAGEGIAVLDCDLKLRLWNQFLERLTGMSAAQVTSLRINELFPNMEEMGILDLMRSALQGNSTQSGDVAFNIVSTGERGWISCTFEPHRDGSGNIVGIIAVVHDVSERHHAEEKLRLSGEKFRSLIENSTDIICAFEPDGTISYASPALERVLGSEPLGLHGCVLWNYLHPEDVERVRDYVEHLLDNHQNTTEFEMRLSHGDGSWQIVEASCRNLLDKEAVGGLVINARDISQRKENERALIRAAMHDRLTGLPNRAFFMDRLRLRIERARRAHDALYAVLFLDFDRFKVINDSLGHLVGDQLLIAIGQRLETCLRPGDTVARLGGDEFAILLEDMARVQDALDVAERVQREMRRPFTLKRDTGAQANSHHEVFTAASIGIALAGVDRQAPRYEHAEDLLRDADMAMYRAKERGRGRHEIFDVAMHQQAMKRLQMETELRAAIEKNAFLVHYQPIVALDDGALRGFEALIRWSHPERGWLAPREFLEVAEETGLIIPLGWWVLREACLQLRHWMDEESVNAEGHAGRVLTMNVNLSDRQFTHPDLLPTIKAALKEAGLQVHHLKLEINESVIVGHSDVVESQLQALHELGVQLGLDDFGTGYSSLSQLHRLHIGALKIDGSFIAQLSKQSDWSMAQTIVELARQLKIDVVAEGIETSEQVDLLRDLNCHLGQGFYFAPPMNHDDVTAFLAAAPARTSILKT